MEPPHYFIRCESREQPVEARDGVWGTPQKRFGRSHALILCHAWRACQLFLFGFLGFLASEIPELCHDLHLPYFCLMPKNVPNKLFNNS